MSTEYHSKLFAHELTRCGGEGVEKLSRSLFDAVVDLNPHQIDAALFAMRSPLSKGCLMADEVGLGKTIEAGIVLCQYWAERKRKVLIICPASLRKQWEMELQEKFNLPSAILDAKAYRKASKEGFINPFDQKKIIITSTHFASRHAGEIRAVKWDIAAIDEAHKLRNVYRRTNKMGQNIKWAIEDTRKMLLTATPLQNSLLELYGLSTIIDENIFGDLPSFKTQYTKMGSDMDGLRNRLKSFSTRSLRRQVVEYIKYTDRIPVTIPFSPQENEQKLYEAVTEYLQDETSYAFPPEQRHLITLVVWKQLASSTQAVAGTLEKIKQRLVSIKDNTPSKDLLDEILEGEDIDDDIIDEIDESDELEIEEHHSEPKFDVKKLEAEIDTVSTLAAWARSIGISCKTKNLLQALNTGFEKMSEMGAARKAVVFTESRRTQQQLIDFLESNGFAGKAIIFNGTNTDPASKAIYEQWHNNNADNGRASGSRAVDSRTAIIEHFRDNAEILIATEAAAEGINLQFCSLVINFDLPWNPQRVEQRIGRCHRYGQKHDVVVVNFLNSKNHADQRVYELLRSKFNLFEGVFGASDEVLGTISSGVDFEKRILAIYSKCRTSEEIEKAFNALQEEMSDKIKSRMQDTRSALLDNFDEDVHERLKISVDSAKLQLDKFSRMFWRLTQYILSGSATFNDSEHTFLLDTPPLGGIEAGKYHLIKKTDREVQSSFLYRLSHPLGEFVLEQGKKLHCPLAELSFDITNHSKKISVVEQLKGKSGYMQLEKLTIDTAEKEEYLLFTGFDDNGNSIESEICRKMFRCGAMVTGTPQIPSDIEQLLSRGTKRYLQATLETSLEQNNDYFKESAEKLDKWADDMVVRLEDELRKTKDQLKALKREVRKATTLTEQEEIQKRIASLEKKKRRQRASLEAEEDAIEDKRDKMVDQLRKRIDRNTSTETLFTLRWKIV